MNICKSLIHIAFLFITSLSLLYSNEIKAFTPDTQSKSSGLATIRVNNKIGILGVYDIEDGILVLEIDGSKVKGNLNKVQTRISLPEGSHTIMFQYVYNCGRSMQWGLHYSPKRILDFNVETGKEYAVKMKYSNPFGITNNPHHELFICWIEDIDTGAVISKIHEGSEE